MAMEVLCAKLCQTSNSTDTNKPKVQKKRKKENKSNNNITTKEVFKGTTKDRAMKDVVITTEIGNLTRQYQTFVDGLQQHFTMVHRYDAQTDTNFEVTPPDMSLYSTTATRPIIGVVPPMMETVFAVFDPNFKQQMNMEWGNNFKLEKKQCANYKKNINTTYSMAHSNICV